MCRAIPALGAAARGALLGRGRARADTPHARLGAMADTAACAVQESAAFRPQDFDCLGFDLDHTLVRYRAKNLMAVRACSIPRLDYLAARPHTAESAAHPPCACHVLCRALRLGRVAHARGIRPPLLVRLRPCRLAPPPLLPSPPPPSHKSIALDFHTGDFLKLDDEGHVLRCDWRPPAQARPPDACLPAAQRLPRHLPVGHADPAPPLSGEMALLRGLAPPYQGPRLHVFPHLLRHPRRPPSRPPHRPHGRSRGARPLLPPSLPPTTSSPTAQSGPRWVPGPPPRPARRLCGQLWAGRVPPRHGLVLPRREGRP